MLLTVQEVTSEDKREVFRKWQKCVLKCKEVTWIIFHCKDLVVFREQHNLSDKDKLETKHIGSVVMIKGESKNRQHWKLAIVEKLHSGKKQCHQSSWITHRQKISKTTNKVIVPNRITLQNC